jgi:hypothetical protein
MKRWHSIACLAAMLAISSCSPGPGIESEAETCLPPDTLAVAGMHPERVRGREANTLLPPAWLSALEPFRGASLVLLAYNGSDVLVIAAGRFAAPPPGAVLLTPQLTVAGSPAAIRAATAQHGTRRTGAAELVARAAPVLNKDIWAVIRGGARLPLPGNAANANRLLALTEYTTLSATLESGVRLEADGYCATAESGSRLEERLRALITLGKTAAKRPDLAALFQSIELARDGSEVHLRLRASPQAIEELLR